LLIEFEEEKYSQGNVYYVRAIQEPTLAINGNQFTKGDEDFLLCKGSFRTELSDNCLGLAGERAWSSPIYLNKP